MTNIPHPRGTHKSRTGNKPPERGGPGRAANSPSRLRVPAQQAPDSAHPSHPHGLSSRGRPAALPEPRPRAAAPLIPWSPRSTCLSLFSERPTGACRGAASEADRARGWGSPRRTRPRSSRQRGRQKPCSALMGPNPLGCRVWVTARRAGVSLRLRREPGRLYGLQLG